MSWAFNEDEDVSPSDEMAKPRCVRKRAEASEALKAAEHAAKRPWWCVYCGDRFETQRDAEQHERTCIHSPPSGHGYSGWLVRGRNAPARVCCRCGWTAEAHAMLAAKRKLRSHFDAVASPSGPTLIADRWEAHKS